MKLVAGILKFCSGFLSNFACQLVRATLNVAATLVLAAAAAGLSILCVLQFAGGGKRAAKDSASAAWGFAKRSFSSGLAGCLQAAAAASLVGPLLRGGQACNEKLYPKGVYAPAGSGRNGLQTILGLNSWEPEEAPSSKREGKTTEKAKHKAAPTQREISKEVSPPNLKKKDWDLLVANYLAAGNIQETDKARRAMAWLHPVRYMKALRLARSLVPRRNKP